MNVHQLNKLLKRPTYSEGLPSPPQRGDPDSYRGEGQRGEVSPPPTSTHLNLLLAAFAIALTIFITCCFYVNHLLNQ
jgi:hypothetical protein